MAQTKTSNKETQPLVRINGIDVKHLGPIVGATLLVVVGRNNYARESMCIDSLIHELSQFGISVCWYESKFTQTLKLLDDRYSKLSKSKFGKFLEHSEFSKNAFRMATKAGILLMHPSRWVCFLKGKLPGRLGFFTLDFEAFVRACGAQEVFVLSQSAGGILSSYAASETNISGMVCFGYPFQHPDKGPESYRTEHLKNLKTPFLIFQGNRDVYGSYEDAHRYALSPAIRIESIDSGHDYDNLSTTDFSNVLGSIQKFLGWVAD